MNPTKKEVTLNLEEQKLHDACPLDDESCVVVNVPFCNQEGLSRSSDFSGNLEFSEVK